MRQLPVLVIVVFLSGCFTEGGGPGTGHGSNIDNGSRVNPDDWPWGPTFAITCSDCIDLSSEVPGRILAEPVAAVHPADPATMVIVSQALFPYYRSDPLAPQLSVFVVHISRDGGQTWTESAPPVVDAPEFTLPDGVHSLSDPIVGFGADGRLFIAGMAIDAIPSGRWVPFVAWSDDIGSTWNDALILESEYGIDRPWGSWSDAGVGMLMWRTFIPGTVDEQPMRVATTHDNGVSWSLEDVPHPEGNPCDYQVPRMQAMDSSILTACNHLSGTPPTILNWDAVGGWQDTDFGAFSTPARELDWQGPFPIAVTANDIITAVTRDDGMRWDLTAGATIDDDHSTRLLNGFATDPGGGMHALWRFLAQSDLGGFTPSGIGYAAFDRNGTLLHEAMVAEYSDPYLYSQVTPDDYQDIAIGDESGLVVWADEGRIHGLVLGSR